MALNFSVLFSNVEIVCFLYRVVGGLNGMMPLGTQKVFSKCWFLAPPPCLVPEEHVSDRSPQRACCPQKLLLLSLE